MTKINVNAAPYFDDFNEKKKFYQILYKPGVAVQVRELNQIQSSLQNQIEKIGSHLFQNGSQVLPGSPDAVKYASNIGFIKIPKTSFANNNTQIETYWLNKEIESTSVPAGIKAKVIGYKEIDSLNEVRLFVNYLNADSVNGETITFLANQNIQTIETVPVTTTISAHSYAVGTVSSVTVEEGVYFYNGKFILVDSQTIFIEPTDTEDQAAWNNNPTAKCGLYIVESIVTSVDDSSLLDNATGTPNYSAPGADRLAIEATLEQREFTDTDNTDFIELLRVSNGIVQKKVIKTEYSILQDTLARRTYDESGDYTKNPFMISVHNFLNENSNSGIHNESEFYYSTEQEALDAAQEIFGISGASLHPTATGNWIPGDTYNDFLAACRAKLSLRIDTGKAYVKGYEIEKIAPTTLDFDRSRTLKFINNKTINCPLGTYLYITDVDGMPDVGTLDIVTLYNERVTTPGTAPSGGAGSIIGTARALAIEYNSGTLGGADAIYKFYLFDIVTNDGKDINQVKSIVGTSPTFTANTVLQTYRLTGSVEAGTNVLVGTGTSWKNDETQKLKAGDYVIVDNDPSLLYRVTSNPTTDTGISVSPDPASDWTGSVVIDYVYSSVNGLDETPSLIYPLAHKNIYTIRGIDQDNIDQSVIDTAYGVKRVFAPQNSNGSGNIILTLTDPNEEFVPFSTSDYYVVNLITRDIVNLTSGNVLVSGNTVTITVGNVGDSHQAIVTVNKIGSSASQERKKTLIKGTFSAGSYTGTFVQTSSGSSDLDTINLGKCDIFKVTRIVMSPDFTTAASALQTLPTGHKDITNRYLLDNGQRDYYYGVGSVSLLPGAERPSGRVRVEFDYFQHSSTGNYFSVDSYPFQGIGANMTYEEIPLHISAQGVYDLKDCIDFRHRVDETSPTTFSIINEVPRDTFRADYHFYLNRIDKLCLDKTGVFFIQAGIPDLTPVSPKEPDTSMALYELYNKAYTAYPEDCVKKYIDNKRYTMRDIGKLEKRIQNLEYYTTLSLLEKETSELLIKDASGLDRFKNGFLVDNFSGITIGDISNLDYECSIDIKEKELRPTYYSDNVPLFELNLLEENETLREQNRIDSHYQKTGDLYTLPFTTEPLIEQTKCSKVSNVNPYGVFTFVGRVSLTPWSDEWRDTSTVGALQIQDSSAYDNIKAGFTNDGIIWGEWQNNWTGIDTTNEKTGTRKLIFAGHNDTDLNKLSQNDPNLIVDSKRPITGAYLARVVNVKEGKKNKKELEATQTAVRVVQHLERTTTTMTGEKIRQGIQNTVEDLGFLSQNLGSRIIETVSSEYIRSREVEFKGSGFLPGARLYPFFDDVDVSDDCKPTSGSYGDEITADEYGRVSGTFLIPNNSSKKFRTGDRIFRLTVSPSNTKVPSPGSYGDVTYTAKGWIDVKQDTILSTRQYQIHTNLVTERDPIEMSDSFLSYGEICREDPIAQSFYIESKGGCFIRAVDVFFYSKDPIIPVKLQIRPLGAEGGPTNRIVPFSEVIKEAFDVVTNEVDLNAGTLTVTGNSINSGDDAGIPGFTTGPWNTDASYSNSLEEIYHVRSKSQRYVQSGIPLGLSSDPAADMIPTRFVFDSPVYLEEGQDYCFVLLSDSQDYNAWVSQSGPDITGRSGVPNFRNESELNTEIGTNIPILKDPFLNGVYFKSSNGRSWVQDQTIDIKFAIHKCVFDISTTGEVEFVNSDIPSRKLGTDSIFSYNGSTKIRVFHPNHGMAAPTPYTRVVLSGVVAANWAGGSLAAIEALINHVSGHKIESCDLDSYVIDLATTATDLSLSAPANANATGRFGGIATTATENKKMDSISLITTPLNFSDTNINWKVKTTTSTSVHSSTLGGYVIKDFSPIPVNETFSFDSPRQISCARNELNATDTPPGPSQVNTSGLGDKKSLHLLALLTSVNTNLSPVIDDSRLSVLSISNRLDDPSGYDAVNPIRQINTAIDNLVIAPTTTAPAVASTAGLVTFGSNYFQTNNAALASQMSKIMIGKLLSITGSGAGDHNISNVRVNDILYTPAETTKCKVFVDATFSTTGSDAANITITLKDKFIDEISPLGGSCASKYVTKSLVLSRQSTALKVMFDAHRPDTSKIELYYKIQPIDDTTPIDDNSYVYAPFNLDINGILTEITPKANDDDMQISAYESTINGLTPFQSVAIKLVMRGTNSARVPRIKNLKVIAIDE